MQAQKYSNRGIEKTKEINNNLETQIKQKLTNCEIILGGDFNAKLEIKDPRGEQYISRNGKLLQSIIDNNNLEAKTTKTSSGLWTRVNRTKPEEKSVIDYTITTKVIVNSIKSTTVDEEGSLRIKGKKETDHTTIITEIRINDP